MDQFSNLSVPGTGYPTNCGDRDDETLDEQSDSGGGFLAGVCREWEQATEPAAAAGVRTVVRSTSGSSVSPISTLPIIIRECLSKL